MSDDRMITMAEAVTLTGKSQATLYRIFRQHGIKPEKRRDGKTERNYVSYRKIMAVFAQSQPARVNDNPMMQQHEDRYVRLLEEQVKKLEARNKELEGQVEKWQEKFLAAMAEKEGMLRNQDRPPSTIAGYLISRIWKPGKG
jgi:hypothetical protein